MDLSGIDGLTPRLPDTGIITDTALTPAAGADNSDAAVGIDLLADTATEGERFEVLADSAYGTGDALAALNDAGHTAIIKPWPLRPAVEGGFTLDEFTVTEPDGDQPGLVTCPNGVILPITRARKVVFGAACRGCPLRACCTTAARGKTLALHAHQGLQTRAPGPRAGPRLPGRLPRAPADGGTPQRSPTGPRVWSSR